MVKDLRLGAVCVRWDVIIVLVAMSIISHWTTALGFFLVLAIHELGHALAAYKFSGKFTYIIQLTGGISYLRNESSAFGQRAILLAGPLSGLIPLGIGHLLVLWNPNYEVARLGAVLQFCAILWSLFQLSPFPPMDGGILLRCTLGAKLGNATWAWRLGWLLGFASVVLAVAADQNLLEPLAWLTGMAVILGRSDAGYVRHLDAYAAWERGDYREVVNRVEKLPDYLALEDQIALMDLGLAAALELEDKGGVEEMAARLPAARPSVVGAAQWLLQKDRPFGSRLAQQAFDALDSERVKRTEIDAEAWADLAFRYAEFEARGLNPDSALGLLERAVELGFDQRDWLEASAAFDSLKERSRYKALIVKLG